MLKKFRKSVAWNIISWILTIAAAFVVAVLINTYLIRTSDINGQSMQNSFQPGQIVFLSKTPYIFGDPEYKDVIVFDSSCFDDEYKAPTFFDNFADSVNYNVVTQKIKQLMGKNNTPEHRFWIKRVIGVAGDVIEFKDGKLYKNGSVLSEDYIKEQEVRTNPEGFSVTVPEGYVFACGDNRNNSMDCRAMKKCIPVEAILGKVITGENKGK